MKLLAITNNRGVGFGIKASNFFNKNKAKGGKGKAKGKAHRPR